MQGTFATPEELETRLTKHMGITFAEVFRRYDVALRHILHSETDPVKKQDLLHTALEVLNKHLVVLLQVGESDETFATVHKSLTTNVYPHLKSILMEGDVEDSEIMAQLLYALRICVTGEAMMDVSTMAAVLSSPVYLAKFGEVFDIYTATPETTGNQANILSSMTVLVGTIFPDDGEIARFDSDTKITFEVKFVRALIQCGKIYIDEFSQHLIDGITFGLTELNRFSNMNMVLLLLELSPKEFKDVFAVLFYAPLTSHSVCFFSMMMANCLDKHTNFTVKFKDGLNYKATWEHLCKVLGEEGSERLDYNDKLLAATTLIVLYDYCDEELKQSTLKNIKKANDDRITDHVDDDEMILPDGEELSWGNLMTRVRELEQSTGGAPRRNSRRVNRKMRRKATRRFRREKMI